MRLGFFGGAFVGGTFGAMQGALLAVVAVVAIVSSGATVAVSAAVPTIVAVTILGTLAGALIGGVIGPLLGAMASLCGLNSPRWLFVFGLTASTFCAVIASVFAIQLIAPKPTTWEYVATIATGIANGFVGGMVLVRGLIRLARQAPAMSNRNRISRRIRF